MARDRDIKGREITFQNFKGINNVADANNLRVEELVRGREHGYR